MDRVSVSLLETSFIQQALTLIQLYWYLLTNRQKRPK